MQHPSGEPLLARRRLLHVALLLPAARWRPAQGGKPKAAPSDAELLKLYKRQKPELRQELLEWFGLEAQSLPGYYGDCLKVALRLADRDPAAWPEAAPPRHYDPETHAPGQAQRRVLSERSSQVQGVRKRLFGSKPPSGPRAAYRYDWGSREIVRPAADMDEGERLFQSALAGCAPQHDLGVALLERALDDGAAQKELAAFGHSYSSRDGDVYGEITLYEAWSSGKEIEMPDVDCLGVLHDVADDWKSYQAPVPDSLHDELYERIARFYERARSQRELRRALAQCYLRGHPELAPAFLPHCERFHALWERVASDPTALRLPTPEETDAWLERTGKELDTNAELWNGGLIRQRALDEGAAAVRERLLWVMRELGILAR